MKLPEPQLAVLEAASANDQNTIEELAKETSLNSDTAAGAAFALEEEGLVEVADRTCDVPSLTAEGEQYVSSNLPENDLYSAAIREGADTEPVQMDQAINAAGLEGQQVEIALSNYARKGYGSISGGEISANPNVAVENDTERLILQELDEWAEGTLPRTTIDSAEEGTEPGDRYGRSSEEVYEQLERRGLIEREVSTTRSVLLTDEGVTALMEGVEPTDTVGQLTPEMLTTGEWRDVEFGAYNVEADAERAQAGRIHPLRRTAERVTDVLVGMGFEEMDGPHADAEFWINDCLFMPQDHPARTHWDQFTLAAPDEIDDLPDELVAGVEHAHREGVGPDGDGYHSPWSADVARRLSLRGHTTSLSARYLAGVAVGDLEPPQRLFSVEKVYRNDTLDATHLLEFFQIEGLVMAENLSVRDLMGTFTEFYEQFGITDLEFKPTYNPYTEPSFELFGEHPTTGELVEIGNSGLFRPEMLDPLGVDCDVMAWGLALERLLMLTHGFEDIRDVHGTLVDLDFLRNAEVIY
jgi:phenylalanyl-tRNA synthetase alpha chain